SQYGDIKQKIIFDDRASDNIDCWTIALTVMIRNIIQNALLHSDDNSVTVLLTDSYLAISNQKRETSSDISCEESKSESSDEFNCGIGLTLCQNLAEIQTMQLEFRDCDESNGISVTLHF
ncbi:MAG: hypothetical protein OQJ89_16035, partial [Kangiellaceae bacterium]|nr:hypothetical protein [Kangiellaceae bacterium]